MLPLLGELLQLGTGYWLLLLLLELALQLPTGYWLLNCKRATCYCYWLLLLLL